MVVKMVIINIVVGFILFFSFLGGAIQGAIKSFFSLMVFIIAIPIAAHFYSFFAGLLSFLPGHNWENFIGFFITLAIASVVLTFVFFFPRKLMEIFWKGGALFRLGGGVLNLLGALIGLTMFTYIISTYNVWDWLQQGMVHSEIIKWMVSNLSFVRGLLLDLMHL
jgi:uncharacterized membrane protein required for colicin V production